jgi:dienelactone hydrolase
MGLRRLAAFAALTVLALAPAAARAQSLPSLPGLPPVPGAPGTPATGPAAFGGQAPCAPNGDVLLCSGKVATFDGVPLDTNLGLPIGGATNLPLVVFSHGWGGAKHGPDEVTAAGTMRRYVEAGYAVLSFTARGFNGSCGTPDARLAGGPACVKGFIRLDDWRFEARDVQFLAGQLADAGTIDGRRIGATGESYGGGVSMELAALRDRISDGSSDGLVPWRSPGGKPMRIAAAAPVIPWSDLTYSLMPNGRHLDYTIASTEQSRQPIGVSKASYTTGLYGLGQATGYYQPTAAATADAPTTEADLDSWYARIEAGDPYDGDPVATRIADLIARYHSPYDIPADSAGPAPMFISNGFTDDLFPVDEALRMYNRTRATFPGTPLALQFQDFGHARGQNKPADAALLANRIQAWLDRYVKGDRGADAPTGVTALTQTCPKAAPSGGPFHAATWAQIHPGEVRFDGAGAQTVVGGAFSPGSAQAFDPIAGGDACATAPANDPPGTAAYRLPAATGDGYTLLGSPTIVANLNVTGVNAQLAARLVDVAPDGQTETLVARGVLRPAQGRQVFQLHPGAWTFAPGHVAKLELLGADPPYARPSNGAFTVAVSDLQLRLPTQDRPDCGQVRSPLAPVVPPGATLAPGVSAKAAPVRRCR